MFVVASLSTSILLQWSVIADVEPSGYIITYSNTNTQCFNDTRTISITNASAEDSNIPDLQEGTEYRINVILERVDGATDEDIVIETTAFAGTYIH